MRHHQDYSSPRSGWSEATLRWPEGVPLPPPDLSFGDRQIGSIVGNPVQVRAGVWGEHRATVRLYAQILLETREVVFVSGVLRKNTPEEVISAIVAGITPT